MIYHTLLAALLRPAGSPGATDFAAVWQRVGVPRVHKFSEQFMQAAQLPPEVNHIDQLVKMLHRMVETASVAGLDSRLTIEYRTERSRFEMYERKKRERMEEEKKKDVSADEQVGVEMASVVPVPVVSEDTLQELVEGVVDPTNDLRQQGVDDAKLAIVDVEDVAEAAGVQQSPKARKRRKSKSKARAPNSTSLAGSEPVTDAGKYDSVVVGRERFEHDESALDAYLRDILQWWHGERPSRGVKVELTRRCQ
jgi:exonuclease V